MLITSNHKFVIMYARVVQGSNQTVQSIVAVEALTGSLIYDVQPPWVDPHITSLESLCTLIPAPIVNFGHITEISNTSPWYGAATIPGTRCWILITILNGYASFSFRSRAEAQEVNITGRQRQQHQPFANGQSNYEQILTGYVQTSGWASYTEDIVLFGESILLFDVSQGNAPGATMSGFPISPLLDGLDGSVHNIFPAFAAQIVIASATIGALWMAAQVVYTDALSLELKLFAFESGSNFNHVTGATVATYKANDPHLNEKLSRVSVFSVPRPLVPMVCVVAFNLTCFSANSDLQNQVPAVLSTPFGLYGQPQLGDGGIMIFARDGYPCQAITFTESDLAPRVLWDTLIWDGMADGIDMNVNSSSCENAILTNEALVMLCSPIGSSHKHTYLVEALTGRIILAKGPRALLGSVVVAGSGESVSYATAFNTAITILLAGISPVTPITMESSFCIVDSTSNYPANYCLRFSTSEQTITATRAPWDFSANQQITISMSNSSVFPLSARQFKGPSGVLMGATFELAHSSDILALLRPVLPAVLTQTLNFIRGPVVSLTRQDYSTQLTTSQSCQVCDSRTCPKLCTIELATGDQLFYLFGFNSLKVSRKLYGNSNFGPPSAPIMVPFYGNASLTASKLAYDLSSTMQTLDCEKVSSSQTSKQSSGRCCMSVPTSSGKQYVAVEIGPSGAFATVTSFSLSWGATSSVSKQTFQPSQVWSVLETVTLANLINSSLGISFPDSLPNGIKVEAIITIVTTTWMLTVYTISDDGTDVFQLSTVNCEALDADVPLCPTTLPDTSSFIYNSARTVVWKGDSGNWGDGFVAAGTVVNLWSIMRNPSMGNPAQCGGSDNVCPTQCQPTANCLAQRNSYFYNLLYAIAMLPRGSSAPVPEILQASCEDVLYVPTNESMPLQVTFFCTSEGNVVLSSSLQGVALGTTFESSTLGVQFSCSMCTYFMYVGILPQPFEWIAAGAVKNLIVTTLLYVLLEKIRANHRLQTRTKSRLRHHHERLRLLEARLDEHRRFRSAVRGSDEDIGNSCPTLPYLSLTNQALDAMSEEDRRDEFHLLTNEITRANIQIQDDQIGIAAMEAQRWTGTRWLPNPITVYSNIVLKFSGVRNPSERRLLLVRVQDGLSSKHVTEQQLVDMLLRITGGSTTNERHEIEAFSTYYQWNMCLNRQVVVRDYIDESAHAGAPGIKEAVDHSLNKIHQRLREVYVLFRISPQSSQGTEDSDYVSLPLESEREQQPATGESEPLIATERRLAPPTMDLGTSGVVQAKLQGIEGEFLKRVQDDLHNDRIPNPTINAPLHDQTILPSANSDKCQLASDCEQNRHRAPTEMLNNEVKAFVELIHVHPQCFEYASLPSRSVDDKLTPSTILLLLSLLQFVVSIAVYTAEILEKKGNPMKGNITSFDAYQTVFFMAFNSSAPSALLVSAIARADLNSISSSQGVSSKFKEILTDPYVVFILALFSAPFATHVLPGTVLYGWLLIPPLAAVLYLEHTLRKRMTSQTLVAVVARFLSRVLILFVAALVSTLSYNYSSIYIYSSPDGYMMSGSYSKVGYLQTVSDDFKARDLECYYTHITTTISNFLQMGFTSAY